MKHTHTRGQTQRLPPLEVRGRVACKDDITAFAVC
jgi:hypothetical protein